MSFLYFVEQVRAAENALLAQQSVADELMQSAASEVADVARSMLPDPEAFDRALRVLLLVGPGGNGGDALYAGRDLLQSSCDSSFQVSAFAFAGPEKTHATARAAFEAAGGTFLDSLDGDLGVGTSQGYDLVIDGLFGLGNRGGVGEQIAEFLHWSDAPVLAVDIPSGVAGDTGAVPEPVGAQLEFANHVRADVTVTFGGLRRAHGLTVDCGRVVCRDIHLRTGESLFDALLDQSLEAQQAGELSVVLYGPPAPVTAASSPSMYMPFADAPADETDLLEAGDTTLPFDLPGEPGAASDKYSGGVVGICAGSSQYPGAGILSTTAAVRATSSMVRWVGEDPLAIVLSNPEVVVHPSVDECGRVQAWVVGPGRGTDAKRSAELAEILEREEPVLVDADGLTLLADNPELLGKLRTRGSERTGDSCPDGTTGDTVYSISDSDSVSNRLDGATRQTIITPHAGEFARLAKVIDLEVGDDRIDNVARMARELGCTVLLKGRFTVITDGVQVDVVDAGSSWAATAGSGDVLAGIIGALLAERGRTVESALVGQFIHSVATYVSAHTQAGAAPTSASRIAEKIPEAIALLSQDS